MNFFYTVLTISLLISYNAQASREAVELFKDGYTKRYESCCVSFDGCDYDKTYEVGLHTFECNEYHYHYEYGHVYILSNGSSSYLCTGDDNCYRGQLR